MKQKATEVGGAFCFLDESRNAIHADASQEAAGLLTPYPNHQLFTKERHGLQVMRLLANTSDQNGQNGYFFSYVTESGKVRPQKHSVSTYLTSIRCWFRKGLQFYPRQRFLGDG